MSATGGLWEGLRRRSSTRGLTAPSLPYCALQPRVALIYRRPPGPARLPAPARAARPTPERRHVKTPTWLGWQNSCQGGTWPACLPALQHACVRGSVVVCATRGLTCRRVRAYAFAHAWPFVCARMRVPTRGPSCVCACVCPRVDLRVCECACAHAWPYMRACDHRWYVTWFGLDHIQVAEAAWAAHRWVSGRVLQVNTVGQTTRLARVIPVPSPLCARPRSASSCRGM